jgi:hypothetical protein
MRHLILTLVALSACDVRVDADGDNDGDNNDSDVSFTRVDNVSNARLVLVDADNWDHGDETWHVECDGDDDLSFDVDDDLLVIEGDSSECDVFVVIHGGESVTINGDGDCDADETLEVDHLDLFVRGNGAVHIDDLQAGHIGLDLSGTGDVTLAGAADSADFTISGNGSLFAGDLVVEDLTIDMSGTGEVTVNVTGSISGSVTGSGTLEILGDPEGDITVTGSGVVIGLDD